MSTQNGASYTGVDNLEVMLEAVNYNAFLTDLVLAHARPGDRMLDFGAGIGTFAERLAASGHEVACLEPDPTMADGLRRRGFLTYTDISEIPDQSVDYIYSLNVFEHIEDDAAAARALGRLLRPNGRLLIYVPAFQLLFSSMDRKVCHFRRYTRHSLSQLMTDSNFHVRTSGYADSLGFFASLVYKYFGNKDGDINAEALRSYDRWVFPISRTCDRFAVNFVGKNVFTVGTVERG